MAFDPKGPFRGSTAVAAGLLTRGVLRGPRFQRLFPDVYAPAHFENDLLLRSLAAGVLVAGRGVVAGYSAAELLGASSGPPDAPAEVLLTAPRCQSYRCTGLRVHRDRSAPDEIIGVDGVAVTTPERTAFDLARWAPTLTERVAAVDALAYRRRVDIADVTILRHRHLGARHGGEVAEVLRLTDRRAESPMESRARMALVLGGLPSPAVQHPVVIRNRRYYLDLAYPHRRVAIEYDGADHRTQQRARRDLEREAALASAGWRVLRFDAHVVLFAPERIVAEVRAELAAAQ
jgi:very-short-patch-repair endonuclease